MQTHFVSIKILQAELCGRDEEIEGDNIPYQRPPYPENCSYYKDRKNYLCQLLVMQNLPSLFFKKTKIRNIEANLVKQKNN
jgi:hypothetical protein